MLTPTRKAPLRVAVLCSRRAPGLDALLAPEDKAEHEVVGVITSDPASAVLPRLAGAHIRSMVHDVRAFHQHRGAPLSELSVRREFDQEMVRLLAGMRPDLVVLAGYLYVVTDPVLTAYPDRVINIHDADLSMTDLSGLPRYRGLHSTRDAVIAGEPETRSTVHLVTARVDVGPLLLKSRAFPVHPMIGDARRWNAVDLLKAYAYAQREWMMRSCWGRLLTTAVELFAWDAVRVVGEQAMVSGIPGPLLVDGLSAQARRESSPSWRAS